MLLGLLTKAVSSVFTSSITSPRKVTLKPTQQVYLPEASSSLETFANKQTDLRSDPDYHELLRTCVPPAVPQHATEDRGSSPDDCEMKTDVGLETPECRAKKIEYLDRCRRLQTQEREHEAKESGAMASDVTIVRTSQWDEVAPDADSDSIEIAVSLARNAPWSPNVEDSAILYDGDDPSPYLLFAEVIQRQGGLLQLAVHKNFSKLQDRVLHWRLKPAINEVLHQRCFAAFTLLKDSDSSILRVLTGAALPQTVPAPMSRAPSTTEESPQCELAPEAVSSDDGLKKMRNCPCLACRVASDKRFDPRDPLDVQPTEDAGLNVTQAEAIERALTSNISLIQGPPGTGKTCTIVQLIKRLSIAIGRQTGQILCVTPSNAASDHLAMCLLKAGLIVYRPRSSKKVKKNLKKTNPDLARIAHHPRGIIDPSLPPRHPPPFNQPISKCGIADVVSVTCCFAASAELLMHKFRYLIVDEAAQATEPEVLIPYATNNITKLILVGDHKQLGPTVKAMRGKSGLEISMFERLCGRGIETSMLTEQFRMPALLSLFSSRNFYGNKLTTSSSVSHRYVEHPAIYSSPMKLIDISHGRESDKKLSKENPDEAFAVIAEISSLVRAGVKPPSIKVITPYSAQRDLIKAKLSSLKLNGTIHIGSVDSMQGSEADIIIVSTVRSNREKQIGFVSDARRMNVTLTRAKFQIVLVCNVRTLKSNRLWQEYLQLFWSPQQSGVASKALRSKYSKANGTSSATETSRPLSHIEPVSRRSHATKANKSSGVQCPPKGKRGNAHKKAALPKGGTTEEDAQRETGTEQAQVTKVPRFNARKKKYYHPKPDLKTK